MFPLEIKSIYIITDVKSCGSLLAICIIILILFILVTSECTGHIPQTLGRWLCSSLRVYSYWVKSYHLTQDCIHSWRWLNDTLIHYCAVTQWYSYSLLCGDSMILVFTTVRWLKDTRIHYCAVTQGYSYSLLSGDSRILVFTTVRWLKDTLIHYCAVTQGYSYSLLCGDSRILSFTTVRLPTFAHYNIRAI